MVSKDGFAFHRDEQGNKTGCLVGSESFAVLGKWRLPEVLDFQRRIDSVLFCCSLNSKEILVCIRNEGMYNLVIEVLLTRAL